MKVIVSDHDGAAYDLPDDVAHDDICRRLGHHYWHFAEVLPLPNPPAMTVGALIQALERYKHSERDDPIVVVAYGPHLYKIASVEGQPNPTPIGQRTLTPVPLLVLGDELQKVDW